MLPTPLPSVLPAAAALAQQRRNASAHLRAVWKAVRACFAVSWFTPWFIPTSTAAASDLTVFADRWGCVFAYVVGVLATVPCFLLTHLLARIDPVFASSASWYYASVLAVAWWFGWGPSLVTGMLNVLLALAVPVPQVTNSAPMPQYGTGALLVDALLTITVYLVVGVLVGVARRRGLISFVQAAAALDAERKASAVRDEFLTIASHELKTPLTSLKLALSLVRRRIERLPGEQAARITMGLEGTTTAILDAETQIARLTRSVNEMLDDARISRSAALVLAPEAVDLTELLVAAVRHARGAHPERGLLLHAPRRRCWVLGDADRLLQVIENYLNNAFKFSPESQHVDVLLHVERPSRPLAADQRPHFAVVTVTDYGRGVPLEDQERIWERFHQGDQGEATGSNIGLGLGLYIVRTIVTQHGGTCGVQSAENAGSSFWFRLPLLRPPEVPEAADYLTSLAQD